MARPTQSDYLYGRTALQTESQLRTAPPHLRPSPRPLRLSLPPPSAAMQLLRLLQLLLLPTVVDAFGGLNYVSTNTGTSNGAPTVVLPPGDMKTDFGWDQTANDPLAASAIIGNTRINVWKWQTPPAPPPPAQPSRGRHGEDGRPTDGPEGGTSADLQRLQVLPIVSSPSLDVCVMLISDGFRYIHSCAVYKNDASRCGGAMCGATAQYY